MTDQLENEPTQQLPPALQEARLAIIEKALTDQQAILQAIDGKMDMLVKMQQDMYVDLRGRFIEVNSALAVLANTVNQIQKDMQPDSFQNRLMRMGQ